MAEGFGKPPSDINLRISSPGEPVPEDIDDAHKRVLDFASEMYDKATAYENIIVVGGYAAFFALWSAVARDLPQSPKLWAVALLIISLVSYVTFHILQMVVRSVTQMLRVKALMKASTPGEKAAAIKLMGTPSRTMNLVMMLWPLFLGVSIIAGISGAILVGFNALAMVLGWPSWPT